MAHHHPAHRPKKFQPAIPERPVIQPTKLNTLSSKYKTKSTMLRIEKDSLVLLISPGKCFSFFPPIKNYFSGSGEIRTPKPSFRHTVFRTGSLTNGVCASGVTDGNRTHANLIHSQIVEPTQPGHSTATGIRTQTTWFRAKRVNRYTIAMIKNNYPRVVLWKDRQIPLPTFTRTRLHANCLQNPQCLGIGSAA